MERGDFFNTKRLRTEVPLRLNLSTHAGRSQQDKWIITNNYSNNFGLNSLLRAIVYQLINIGLTSTRPQIKIIKSVAYSFQRSHTGQLDFCNCLADNSYSD